MLELKEFELKDEAVLRKEWEFIRDLPENENGFTNAAHGIGWEEFLGKYIPRRIQFLTGESLEEGLVRQADYLLWADDAIAGIFRIRAELNDFLRNVDGGHIGYGIKREFRGKGLATYGLRLALAVLQEKTSDREAILFCRKDNPASLRVMQKTGARIFCETDENFSVRIPLRRAT